MAAMMLEAAFSRVLRKKEKYLQKIERSTLKAIEDLLTDIENEVKNIDGPEMQDVSKLHMTSIHFVEQEIVSSKCI